MSAKSEHNQPNVLFLILLSGMALSNLTACALSGSSGSTYRNSVFSNHNPAPAILSPPSMDGRDPATVDPTYMRTQADYHFAMGEALSLDGESQKAVEAFKLATVYDATSAELRLRLAAEFLKQGLMSESIDQAEQAVQLDPTHVDSRIFLGGVYSSLKMYPQAEDQYHKILEVDPKNTEVLIYLGALQSEKENYAKAEEYFLKAARAPNNERAHLAYYYLAKMHLGQKDRQTQKAIKALNQALSKKPDFEEAVLTLADVYEFQQKRPKAIELLEAFQRQFGPKKNIAESLSQIYLEKEDFKKAFEHLKTLESFDPSNLNVKVKLALILIEQKKYDDAILRLEQILSVAPSSDKIRYYLAAVFEEIDNQKQAIFNYKHIDKTSTYFPDATIRAANLMRKSGDFKGALALMQEAIGGRDDAPTLYAFYASLLDESNDYATGVTMLEGATKKFPENTQLLFYLGNLYDRTGKADKSIAVMKKIIDLDGNHVQALNYLAFTYADMSKNLDEAEQLAIRALDLQPNDGYILDTVGWVYFKKGQVEESIRYLEAALNQKPDESIVAEHLGDAYYVYELKDKAKEMYLRAVKLESNESKVKKIRAKIVTMEKAQQNLRSPASVGNGQ